jgi:hypothetical protein
VVWEGRSRKAPPYPDGLARPRSFLVSFRRMSPSATLPIILIITGNDHPRAGYPALRARRRGRLTRRANTLAPPRRGFSSPSLTWTELPSQLDGPTHRRVDPAPLRGRPETSRTAPLRYFPNGPRPTVCLSSPLQVVVGQGPLPCSPGPLGLFLAGSLTWTTGSTRRGVDLVSWFPTPPDRPEIAAMPEFVNVQARFR